MVFIAVDCIVATKLRQLRQCFVLAILRFSNLARTNLVSKRSNKKKLHKQNAYEVFLQLSSFLLRNHKTRLKSFISIGCDLKNVQAIIQFRNI